MRTTTLLPSALLLTSISAAPGQLVKKAAVTTCAADNCLRAVRALSAAPGTASAAADCTSFLRTIITPCPTTTTSTKIVTITQSPALATVTNVINNTQLNTIVNTQTTTVKTIIDTATVVQPSAVQVFNSIVSPVTVTAQGAGKRDPLGARATCAASSSTPTNIPAYASACAGTARYASACVCNGATGITTTLTQATSTATTISTVTVIPTLTSAITLVNNVPVTVTATQYVPATFETTAATVVVPSAYTVTSDLIIPTTIVVSPSSTPTECAPGYLFQVKSGPFMGKYIGSEIPVDQPGKVRWETLQSTEADEARRWNIDGDGRIYTTSSTGQNFMWAADKSQHGGQMWLLSQQSLDASPSRQAPECFIQEDNPALKGSLGSIGCLIPALWPEGRTEMYWCPDSNVMSEYPNYSFPGDCEMLELAVYPAPCV